MTEDRPDGADPKEELPDDFRESFFGPENQDSQDDQSDVSKTSGPTTQELRELSPEEIQEKYPPGDDHPLVQETGKTHIELGIEPTAENAVFYLFLQGLRDRVDRLTSDVQEDLKRSDNTRVDLPLGSVGIGIYQIHALTTSFFESSSYLLVTDYLRQPDRSITPFVEYYESNEQKDILQGDMGQEEIIEAIHEDLKEDANAGQYQYMLNQAGIVDGYLFDVIGDVKDLRNSYLHNPTLMMEISGDEQILEMLARCVFLLEEVAELLEDQLEINWTIYDALESIE